MTKNLLFLLGFVSSVVFGQQRSNAEKEILRLQDQRSLVDGTIVSFLSHQDEAVRYRAALALASIQDTSTIKPLLPLLKDNSSRVRSAAAFALGEIGSVVAEDSLLAALWSEQDPVVFGRLAEALGRSGTENALLQMVERDYDPAMESVRDQYVLAIARFALQPLPVRTERSLWYCFDQLTHANASVRWAALYGLWRAAPLRVIDIEIAKRIDDLKKLATDPSPDVRMHFATLLGKSKMSEAVDLLKQLSSAEQRQKDWRVQVALVRSFGALVPATPILISDVLGYLKSTNDHVVIAALQLLGSFSPALVAGYNGKADVESALVRLSGAENRAELVRGEAIVALGRHFPQRVKTNLLNDSKSSTLLKSKVLEALSYRPSVGTFKMFLKHLEDDSIRVAMAAWDFFRRIANPFSIRTFMTSDSTLTNVPSLLYTKMKAALERDDMAITNLVANTVGDTLLFSLFRGTEYEEKIRDEIVAAYDRLSSPNDTETMQAVLDAIGRIGNRKAVPVLEKALQDPDRTVALVAAVALRNITGQDYSQKVAAATKPLFSDYDWQTLESIAPNQTILVHTTKGLFTLELYKDHAPFTTLSFYKLIQKGFYNGLGFHRVVPNFVVQGGDPRGDGWGGPGYAIRSEYSLVNYERGSVGMASAGKDTEGCQFFVVHSPQPHLDGRYTIFAKVVQGMDVVDNIQVGDRILTMEVGK